MRLILLLALCLAVPACGTDSPTDSTVPLGDAVGDAGAGQPSSDESTRARALIVERKRVAPGRPFNSMVWASDGDLIGTTAVDPATVEKTWVRLSPSTGDSRPFRADGSKFNPGRPLKIIGTDVICSTYDRATGASGYASTPLDGSGVTSVLGTFATKPGFSAADVRMVSGSHVLLLRQNTRMQDSNLATQVKGAAAVDLAGFPKDLYWILGTGPEWKMFIVRYGMRHNENRPGEYLVTTSGSTPVALPAALHGQFHFSPDGSRCMVANTRLTPGDIKTNALLVFPTADPAKTTVLHRGAEGYEPVCWSPDGKAVAAVLHEDRRRLPDTGLWTFPVP